MNKSFQETPLFTVIMPNYNNGKYIQEAIESVLIQTYTNWELVIVDDASTDNSVNLIKTFLSDARIKLIQNHRNMGVAYSAKRAVEESSGEIIGTLDSDDVLDRDAFVIMVDEHIANPEYGLIYSNYYKCDKNLKIQGTVNLIDPLPANVSLQEILLGFKYEKTISWHFRTFKRNAYDKTEGYDVSLLCYEDRDLYYKLEKVTRIKCINKCLLYYRDTAEQGAYRGNPKSQYYWFSCEYKETKRRLGINLPCVSKDNIPLFLSNLIYMYMRRSPNIERKGLRQRFKSFFLETGYNRLKSNKLKAFFYILNSYIYGYTPITLRRVKRLTNRGVSEK